MAFNLGAYIGDSSVDISRGPLPRLGSLNGDGSVVLSVDVGVLIEEVDILVKTGAAKLRLNFSS